MKVTELQRCFGKLVEDKDYQDGMEFRFVSYMSGDNEFIYVGLTKEGVRFFLSFVLKVGVDLIGSFKIDDYFDDDFTLFDCHKFLNQECEGVCIFRYYPSAENSTFGKDRVIKNESSDFLEGFYKWIEKYEYKQIHKKLDLWISKSQENIPLSYDEIYSLYKYNYLN